MYKNILKANSHLESSIKIMSDSQRDGVGHLAFSTKDGMAFIGLVAVGRDEGEHVVMSGIRRTVWYAGKFVMHISERNRAYNE